MKRVLKPGMTGLLLLLCFHTTASSIQPPFTAEVPINLDAGRGGLLFVTLRLDSGDELPFFVDTGSSGTVFDKSLAPKLGKRLGTKIIWLRTGKEAAGIYAAPLLYIGNMRLMTGRSICILNLESLSQEMSHPVMGILGMDCLRHYCIQLDFKASKMRFWGSNLADTSELGKALPLIGSLLSGDSFVHYGSLIGEKGSKTLLDTGMNIDGLLEPKLYQQAIRQKQGYNILRAENGVITGSYPGMASFQKCIWNGETCTNLIIGQCEGSWIHRKIMGGNGNALGLRFLARHLVTLDFPHETMYLKQTSIGPLSSNENTNRN